MDTTIQNPGLSDLAVLAIIVAGSTVAMVVALGAASALKLDRLVPGPKRSSLRMVPAIVLGLTALAVLLGLVPAPTLLQGWGGSFACLAVLGSLVSASVAAWPLSIREASAGRAEESAVGKAAA